jgi:hypothetical protein
MENIEFSKSDRTTWLLVSSGILLSLTWVLWKIEQWGYPEMLLLVGMTFYVFLLVYIISDILKQGIGIRITGLYPCLYCLLSLQSFI